PSNMARTAMQSLIKTGRVVRGFLGASTQDVTPLLAKIFHLPDVKGSIITDLQAKGSAERAGLKRGDVVVRFDGRDVMDSGHLRNLMAAAAIGSKHRVELLRDARLMQAELTVQEAPRERQRKAQTAETAGPTAHPLSGVIVDEITPALARQMDLPANTGLVVTDIEDGSLALSAARRAASFNGPRAPAYQQAGEPAVHPDPKRIAASPAHQSGPRPMPGLRQVSCLIRLPVGISKDIEFRQSCDILIGCRVDFAGTTHEEVSRVVDQSGEWSADAVVVCGLCSRTGSGTGVSGRRVGNHHRWVCRSTYIH
ncbi:MAG: PDZ domain-containing protein, partial [Nitrospira sp. NTP1]|nr:PDZ domain-containing protein [Nitrospira sp. NTP1]